jgi:chromosome segregation ATPase
MVESSCRDLHARLGDLGETTGKHAKLHEVTKVQLQRLCDVFSSFEQHNGMLSNLQESLEALSGHRAAMDAKHTTLDERMSNLTDKLVYLADKQHQHTATLDDHRSVHTQLADELQKHRAQNSLHIDRLEKTVTGSFSDHAQQLAAARSKMDHCLGRIADEKSSREGALSKIEELSKDHQKIASHSKSAHERALKLEERITRVEDFFGAATQDHAKRLQVAHKTVQDIHDQLKNQDRLHQTLSNSMEDRMRTLEGTASETVGRSEIDMLKRKLMEVDGHLKKEQASG